MSTADLWELISFVLKDFQKRGRRCTLKGWAALAAREDRARRSPPMESGCTMGRADPARWDVRKPHWGFPLDPLSQRCQVNFKREKSKVWSCKLSFDRKSWAHNFQCFFPHQTSGQNGGSDTNQYGRYEKNETKNIVLWNFRKWSHLAFLDILVAIS